MWSRSCVVGAKKRGREAVLLAYIGCNSTPEVAVRVRKSMCAASVNASDAVLRKQALYQPRTQESSLVCSETKNGQKLCLCTWISLECKILF